jgi:hypothetical protein
MGKFGSDSNCSLLEAGAPQAFDALLDELFREVAKAGWTVRSDSFDEVGTTHAEIVVGVNG